MEHINITVAKIDKKHIGGQELNVPQHHDYITLTSGETINGARIEDLDYIVEADLLEIKLQDDERDGKNTIAIYVPRRGILWMEDRA
ncbi:MAG: hypothetical protein SVU32_06225 [Candidatus Nanohaloarchaea archaeon]|nr:hypothetical protein [Candidatus Nanohaloarchaea archaeon]